MLPACAHSPGNEPVKADPVIQQRTVVKTLCPADITAPIPASIAVPVGAVIEANAMALGWLRDRTAREKLLESRIIDARKACPHD